MNDTPPDALGLDDPALLAEIEAEFAELTREIARISEMPRTMAPEKTKLVEALRSAWREKIKVHGDRPEWRQRLDETIGRAVDRLLETGIQENPDGTLAFNLRGDVLQEEGGPIMRGLLDGFVHVLEEKFPAPDKAPKLAADAPPPSPMQAIIGSLGHTLAGVLKNAIQNVKMPEAGAIKAGGGGTNLDINIGSSDVKAAEAGGAANTETGFAADKKLSATFELNSKVTTRDANDPQASDAKTTTIQAGATNPAANAFFKQLLAGVGQALQQAAAPAPAPVSAAPQAAAEAAATPSGEADAGDPVGPDVAATAPGAGAKVENPMANIGQSLLQALQRALGPNASVLTARATEVPRAAPAKTTGEATAGEATAGQAADEATEATDPATSANAQGEPAASGETSATAATAGAEAAKPATLQIDFAGLLQQLFGGKKPPGT